MAPSGERRSCDVIVSTLSLNTLSSCRRVLAPASSALPAEPGAGDWRQEPIGNPQVGMLRARDRQRFLGGGSLQQGMAGVAQQRYEELAVGLAVVKYEYRCHGAAPVAHGGTTRSRPG